MHVEVLSTAIITLLHGFTLKIGMKPVPLMWSSQRLVALLALIQPPPSRMFVAGTLWPETTDGRAGANLRSAVWRVQRSCDQLIIASPQRLCLASEVLIDLQDAVAAAYRMLDSTDPCEDILNTGTLSFLSADILPDWYEEDWVVLHRERYHQLRLHALEAMCDRFTEAHRYGEAVEAGLAAVRAEPLRESAHRTLVKAHLAEGNRFEANRQYQNCRRLLLTELGLEPSRGLKELIAKEIPGLASVP
jgi:DNA-binding SARP family transcriptional activator